MLKLEIEPDKKVTRLVKSIDKLEKEFDTEALLDDAAAIILNRTRTRFRDMETPDGKRWPPSRAAQLRKVGKFTNSGEGRKVTGGQTLFASGRLFHSLAVFRRQKGERGLGTNVPYGVFHQRGTSRLPQREFLGFSKDDLRTVEDLIVTRITRALESDG